MNISSTGSSSEPAQRAGLGALLSLRIQLALAFGALAGGLAVALSLVIGHYASEAARDEIGQYLTRLAIEYRDKLDTSLAERMDEVAMLARLDIALPDAAAPERRRARIDQLMRNSDFVWMGYASPAGRVEVASGKLLEGADVSARPWFGAAREHPALLDAHEAQMLSKLLPPTAEPRRFVDLAAPIGPGRGVVGAHVDFAWAARLRADIEAGAPASSPFELMLVQSDGTVMIGPRALIGVKVPMPLGAHVGAPAAIEQWPDGEKYLAGGSASRGIGAGLDLGWVSIARKREAVAFAPIAALQRAILWAGLALALAGIGAGWLLATRLARPLEALADAAAEVVSGKQRAALPVLRDNVEVARLSSALRAMLSHLRGQAGELREAQDRVEQRVRERTAELIGLQAQLELEVADTMVARDDLSRANDQLELALNASNLALWDYDVASDTVYLSASWSQMLGGPPAESRVTSRELVALVPEAERSRVIEAVRTAIAGEVAAYRIEHPVTGRDGGVLWIDSAGRVVKRDPAGRALRIVGTNRDISERVRQTRELRESEERFRSLTRLYSDWYWERDAEHRFTRMDGTGMASIGRNPATLIGKSPFDDPGHETLSMRREEFLSLLSQRKPYRDIVSRLTRPDGVQFYISSSGEPMFGARGEFTGYRGVTRNVTAQVRAGHALRESEDRFRGLTQFSTDLYWELDAELRFKQVAGSGLERLHIRSADMIGKKRSELPDFQLLDLTEEEFERLRAERKPYRDLLARIFRPGSKREGYIRISGEPVFGRDGGFRGYRGVTRDVTAQTRAEIALRESEERFRSLTRLYSDWYWELDPDFRYKRIEGSGLGRIGLAAPDLIGKSPFEALDYKLLSIAREEFDRLLAAREPYRDIVGMLRVRDGRRVYINVSGEPVFGANGEFHGYRGATRNITEQVLAEQAQREADERFRIAFDSAALGMALVAPDGRYLRVNRTLCELLGYSEAELLQTDVWRVTHPEDSGGTSGRMQETLAGARARYQVEKRFLRKDGSTLWAQLDSTLIRDAQGEPLHFFSQVQDITARRAEQRRIEEMAMQDALTGLPNKRLLGDRLAQALSAARRSGQSVGLLYIDLDGFKPVNDSLGHAAGDAVLREVARRGNSVLRDSDTLARAGGDEFVAVLPGAGREALQRSAERLRQEIARPYALGGGVNATIGASIGAALTRAGGENADSLQRRADAAMYEAKRAGRNTIRFAADENEINKEK